VTANVSVKKLFLSGVFPGLMMGVMLIAVWWGISRRCALAAAERATWTERGTALLNSIFALLMPVIILGGMKAGIFTPTEAAVVAAVYAAFVSMVIYRELNWRDMYRVLIAAARTTSVVMFLCGAATVTAYMITLADLPSQLAQSFSGVMGEPIMFMALMMLFLLFVGTAMDLTPTILIFAPVCAPLAVKAGIDPVYFGFMFIYVGCIGLITPPVGTVQNVVAGVAKLRMETVIAGTNPFLAVYILLLAAFTLFPKLVLTPLSWLL
jgi:TRAP-type transport system large permease protein